MDGVTRTWISSTLATEWVSLAASRATLGVMVDQQVPAALGALGAKLLTGFRELAARYPGVVRGAAGLPEMCCLEFHDAAAGASLAVEAARRGVLFKRSAYNFVSLAHDEAGIARALGALDESLRSLDSR
jgi:acetylornithine/succinyldiaminopimelate/putrescine aminotransferase